MNVNQAPPILPPQQSFDPYQVASQYQLFSPLAPALSLSFSSAKTLLVSSGNAYSGLSTLLHSTLLGVQANYQSVQGLLSGYQGSVSPASYDLKSTAGGLFLAVNSSLANLTYRYNATWKVRIVGGGGGGWLGALRGQYRTYVDLMHKTMNFIILMLNGMYTVFLQSAMPSIHKYCTSVEK